MASVANDTDMGQEARRRSIPASAYAMLVVLMLANILNYVDRQILSILAQSIKTDLKLDDAQLGFLMGTAFAVFYSIVGIAMGRISDGVSRKKLMALGLALWSSMTALGGAATNFVLLSVARVGVGVGEATASPCSHSLLADVFPSKNRALALSFYLSGTFIGSAAALIVGGYFVEHWNDFCSAVPIEGACGIANWKAALLAVGMPGIPLALILLCTREPGRPVARERSVSAFVAREFAAALPPFTLLTVFRLAGTAGLLWNLVIAAGAAVMALLLTMLTGDWAQWSALGVGAYAVVTWGQVQKYRDLPLYRLTFGCPTFRLCLFGSALVACIGGAVSAWSAPYAMRTLGMSAVETGLSLGLINAGAAAVGVIVGGWLSDRWKARDAAAPIWISVIALLGGLPSLAIMLTTADVTTFLLAALSFNLFSSLWGGAYAALVQDLVLPRMRGAAASAFSLFSIVVASGLGPYWAGKVSVMTGSLRIGILSMQLLLPAALIILFLAAKRLRTTTQESRRTRAQEAGEPGTALP